MEAFIGTASMVPPHLISVILRLAYLALAAMAVAFVLPRRGRPRAAATIAICANALLYSSTAILSPDRGIWLALCFAEQAAFVAFARKTVSGQTGMRLVAPLTILLGIGATCACVFGADTIQKTSLFQLGGLILCAFASRYGRTASRLPLAHPGIMLFIAVGLFALPAIPGLGVEIGGQTNWVSILGIQFQPSEIAKLCLVFACASFCVSHNADFDSGKGTVLLQGLGGIAICALVVVFTKDLGCLLLTCLLVFFVFLSSVGRKWPLYAIVGILTAALGSVVVYLLSSTVQERVAAWLSPLEQLSDSSANQLAAVLSSLEKGGLLGTGVSASDAVLSLPNASNDYVLCVVTMVLGIAGVALTLLSFAAIALAVARYLSKARGTRPLCESRLVAGTAMLVVSNAIINVAGSLNLIPETGVPLPFVSDGGTSLVICLVSMGVLLSSMVEEDIFASDEDRTALKFGPAIATMGMLVPILFLVCFGKVAWSQAASDTGISLFGQSDYENHEGTVSSADGVVLSQGDAGSRQYPEGDLAGFLVAAIDGDTRFGVSEDLHSTIKGSRSDGLYGQFENALGLDVWGDDLQLTIDSRLQRAAQEILDKDQGAVCLIDTQTGAVLAVASSGEPDLSSDDTPEERSARAWMSPYCTGSTGKLFTLAAAVKAGYTGDSLVDASSPAFVGGIQVINSENYDAGTVTLEEAMKSSYNAAFARLGVNVLGREALQPIADALVNGKSLAGFSTTSTLDYASMPDNVLATAAFGQATSSSGPNVTMPVLAAATAALTNHGLYHTPYVAAADATDGTQAIEAWVAEGVTDILTQFGTQDEDGHTYIGKTGTAEKDNGKAVNALWTGTVLDETGTARYTVAICIEDARSGALDAMPRGLELLQTAIHQERG